MVVTVLVAIVMLSSSLVGTASAPAKAAVNAAVNAAVKGPMKAPTKKTATSAVAPVSSENLLVGNQASFAASTGNWAGYDGTLTWVPNPGGGLPGAAELTASGTTGMSAFSSGLPGPTMPGSTPAEPGVVYEGTAEVEAAAPTTSETVDPAVTFYSSGGSVLRTVPGQLSTAVDGSWTELTDAVGLAPPGTAYATFGVEVLSTAPGERLMVTAASLRGTAVAVPAVEGPLAVKGTEIIQANGQAVALRGMDLWGYQSSAHPATITRNTVVQMHDWGADMVRVSLGEQLWLPTSCAYEPGYRAAIEQVVGWITSLGMVALLDLHYNNPADLGHPLTCPPAGQQIMADAPGSLRFWSQVAKVFSHNPLVAFDLYNEPHTISDQVWLEGGTVQVPGVGPFDVAGMQQLYQAVRQADRSALVVVTGPSWGNDPPTTLVQGVDIAYSVHCYTCPQHPPPGCETATPYAPPYPLLSIWQAFQRQEQVPVIVGEFGWPTPYSGTYIANMIADAQARGWGWAAYEWDGSGGGNYDLIQRAAATGTAEPAPSGMPVLAALTAPDPP